MRILMIYPDLHVHVNYPLGLGILSALLQREGHETRILHFNEEMGQPLDMEVLDRAVEEFAPRLVAFSSVSNQYRYVREMAARVKKLRDLPVLVGGVHATIAADKVLENPDVDLVCRGEGEEAMVELAAALEQGGDFRGIPNLGFREDGGVRLNPLRPLLDEEAFGRLPFPDRESFDFGRLVELKRGWANFMAGRGCLMNCSYCVNHYYRRLYAGTNGGGESLRYRSVDVVLREIEEVVAAYPQVRLVNMDDDNITLRKEWLEEFCEVYPDRVGLPFACNVHPATFRPETARMLAGAGCVEVKIGLESGSERLRREVLRRPSREEVMTRAFRAAEDAGIRAWSFNMIGIPTETPEEMIETARLNAKVRPYIVRCSIFFPYEGTDLYDYSQEHGLIREERADRVSSHLEDTVLDMPQLRREDVLRVKTLFKWYVDAESDIEAAPLFRLLVSLFERLPAETWESGRGRELFAEMDRAVDALLRELRMEHYATRSHLDLNFTAKLGYELP